MFGVLILAIVANAAYLIFQLNRDLLDHVMRDTRDKLNLVFALHNGQIEQIRIISNIVREQNQRFCNFLDYDNVEALSYMIKSLAAIYDLDMVVLFSQEGRVITSYPKGPAVQHSSPYLKLLVAPADWSGTALLDTTVLWDQYPDLEDQSRNPDILCFQSSVTWMHDTGDLYG
jgi:hypothetical protein